MHTQQLTANTQADQRQIERSEEAAIVGEVARHFLELAEVTSLHRVYTLITKLHAIGHVHPEGLRLVLSLLSGDMAEITRSYSDMGVEHARSKQGEEQARARALEAIQENFKELAVAVIELRHITSQIGPVSVKITKEY